MSAAKNLNEAPYEPRMLAEYTVWPGPFVSLGVTRNR